MYDPAPVRAFHEAGWWRSTPLRADIEAHDADAIAFTTASATLTWGQYRCRARAPHLASRQVTREWWPEHLVCVDALPYSAGGKVAKSDLREDTARRFGPTGRPGHRPDADAGTPSR